jgi:hypothetical protein
MVWSQELQQVFQIVRARHWEAEVNEQGL